jgi:hypothetical protein
VTSIVTGATPERFEIVKWFYIEADDDTDYDAAVATSPIRQAEPPAAPRPDPRRPTAVEAARILNEAWAGRCELGRDGVAGHGDRDPAR